MPIQIRIRILPQVMVEYQKDFLTFIHIMPVYIDFLENYYFLAYEQHIAVFRNNTTTEVRRSTRDICIINYVCS